MPTTSSKVYSSPISVSATTTIVAIATASGYLTYPVAQRGGKSTTHNATSVDYGGQAPLSIARVGSNSSALGSGTAVQLEAFSSDGGLTWTPSSSVPINPSTGSAITTGNGTAAVAADGSNIVWAPSDVGSLPITQPTMEQLGTLRAALQSKHPIRTAGPTTMPITHSSTIATSSV
jgi:hypothetical protein